MEFTTARALFVAQIASNEAHDPAEFEHAIDRQSELLRRTDRATCIDNNDLIELRCAIEYGPVRAVGDEGLRKKLERELGAIVNRFSPGATPAVFHLQRRNLSAEDVQAMIATLTAAADDVNLSLEQRKNRGALAALVTGKMVRRTATGGRSGAHLDWVRDPQLAVLKMTAWILKTTERASRDGLWKRVADVFEPITEKVLGSPVTFASVCERYPDLTPARLMGRADHAQRYSEFNEYRDAVERAYADLKGTIA
jgi:hypothetical protein